jgi:hypothetical protein
VNDLNLDQSWSGLIDRAWAGRPNPAESVRQPADPVEFQRTMDLIAEVTREAEELAVSLGIIEMNAN